MLHVLLPLHRQLHSDRRAQLESRTGPLTTLNGKHVLVIADLENLRYSSARLGFVIDVAGLGRCLTAASAKCALHLGATVVPDLVNEAVTFSQQCGWKANIDPRESFITTHRQSTHAEEPRNNVNADNLLSFMAGCLVTRTQAEVIVLASGDGRLVHSLARRVHNLARTRQVLTCSLPGSTSQLLDARRNPFIAGNIEIGRDCLLPLR